MYVRSRIRFSRTALAALVAAGLALVAGNAAAQSWTQVQSPTTEDLVNLDFPTDRIGYAVGNMGTIVKTTDGGATWTQLGGVANERLWYTRFITAESGLAAGTSGALFSTTDGGTTWTSLNTGLKDGSLPSFLFGIQYVTPQLIYAAGGDGEAGGAVVIKSTDGGATWTKTFPAGAFFVDRTAFSDPLHGYTVGSSFSGGGYIYTTEDGGVTWNLTHTSDYLVTSVQTLAGSSANAVAVGSNGMVYRTFNGGASWTPQSIAPGFDIIDVNFRDGENGIAVGVGGFFSMTTDAGTTWTNGALGTASTITGIRFTPSGTTAVAVGDGGVIFRTSIVAGAKEEKAEAASTRLLPNPLRSGATLRLETAEAGEHTVVLYNILGREVLRTTVDAGNGAATIDAHDLAAGRYVWRVISRDETPKYGALVVE